MANPWEMDWSGGQAAPAPVARPTVPELVVAPQPQQPSPAELARIDLDRQKFEYQRQRDAEKTQQNPAGGMTQNEQRAASRTASLDSLVQQINRVQSLYNANLRDEAVPLISSLMEYLPTESNRQFDAASAGLAEQGLAAFRVPGVGAQSDTELRQFVQANKPSASDYDTTIEEKLRQLRARVDANRQAMGMPPADWQGLDAAAPSSEPTLGGATNSAATPPSDGNPPPPLGPSGQGPAPTPFDSNPGGGQTIATGSTRAVFEPAVAAGLNALVQHGRPYGEAAAFAQQHGFPPPSPEEYAAALAWQQAHPNSPYDAANPTRTVETTALEQAAGSPLGAAGIAAGDAASGFTLDNIVGAAGGDAEQARQAMAASAQENPVASTLGTLGGGMLASLGAEAALGGAGVAAGIPRALAADSAYGAVAGAGGTDNGNRLAGAGKGAIAGLGGSVIGNRTGNALARLGRGVTNPSVNALRREGVNALTVGQTFGQSGRIGAAVKGVEDRLSGLPVVGDMVRARQAEGFRQFNAKAFDKALEPIGETVAGQTGEQAIQTAQDKVSQAFKTALSGKGAVPDKTFGKDLAASVTQAAGIKGVGDNLKDELAAIFQPYANDPMLSGEALDVISRNLRSLKSRWGKSNDAMQSSPRVGDAIDKVERAVFDLFDRQASGTIPEYRAARQAYRRVSILEDAVNKARNQKDRIFTPAQLGQSDRTNGVRFGGKRQTAAGNTPFFDLQTAAQDVLPNKVPDSGTAGRLLVPLTLVGAGEGADRIGAGGAGLTLGTILALAYTKGGQRLLTKPGRGIDNAAIQRLLTSQKTGRAIAAGGAATGASLATQ